MYAKHHNSCAGEGRWISEAVFSLGTWAVWRGGGGVVPGVFQVLAVDLRVARAAGALYRYLHLRKSSPLSRLQREMLATVVNGKVGGAP